jgi:spermidine synthase
MLAMVLLGISLGGLIISKCFQKRPDLHVYAVPVLFVNGMLVILLYYFFGVVLEILDPLRSDHRILVASLFLMFPVSFLSGIVFTMLGKALHVEIKRETKASGLLTLANTIGGMIGSLAAATILIPRVGLEKAFFIFALCYGFAALMLFKKRQRSASHKGIQYTAAGLFVLFLVFFPFGRMNQHYLDRSLPEDFEEVGEKRIAIRESLTETIQYLQKDLLGEPEYHRLVTNSYSMSATSMQARRYMKMFVYLPVALHPEPKDALLICFGVGSTAKALMDTQSLKNIEIVDISRDVIEMSEVVYPEPRQNPVLDPRVKIHIEDGRFFLLTSDRTFDLITAEPPPPKLTGIVNLYTQEFFQLIHNRLAEGGIVTYWLPVYQLDVKETKAILKGFKNVFKHGSLWSGAGYEWMMVGIKDPKRPVTESAFTRQWMDPVVGPEMRALGFDNPEQFGANFIADGARLDNWIADTPPLVDNFPRRLSYDDRNWKHNLPAYRSFMKQALAKANFFDSEQIAQLWPPAMRKGAEKYFPVQQTINEMLVDKSMRISNPLFNLHTAVMHPLLGNYLLWGMGSYQRAQNIISNAFDEQTPESNYTHELLNHLAARAAQKRDYATAEHLLSLSALKLGPEHTAKDYLYFAVFRMYFLFLMGNREGAQEVMAGFVNLLDDEKNARQEQIRPYWNWMSEVFQ